MSSRQADTSLYDLSRDELGQLLDREPAYRVSQVWEGLYKQRRRVEDLTNVPKELRRALAELLPNALTPVRSQSADRGTTTKHLWSLHDGKLVEAVLMRYRDRSTICISSQAGCAMGCTFCATGQVGFDRNLSVGEIVEQVTGTLQLADLQNDSINIVFMGMGEPMANLDAVWAATNRFWTDMGIGARHITISTVGIVGGIKRLAGEKLPVNLAVSLHAANDQLRNRLVPINQRYPLRDLASCLAEYRRAKRRRISLEWAMIGGVNDRDNDAAELAEFALPLGAHVNLIPLNPTPGYGFEPSGRGRIDQFAAQLAERGVNTTVRQNRGTSIDAACGQLRAEQQLKIGKRHGKNASGSNKATRAKGRSAAGRQPAA